MDSVPVVSVQKNHLETIEKDLPPQIHLNGDELIKIVNPNDYQEPGFTAIDDIDGDLTEQVETDCIQNGEKDYQISYSVSDSSNNATTVIRNIHVVNGIVCLTFDDGPSCEITPYILDILKEKNAKATFFVVSYNDEKEAILKREYEDGHTIALHGYSHEYSQIYTDIDTIMNNFYRIQNKIKESIGIDSTIIRFPGGSSNTISRKYCVGIMSEAVERVTNEGYVYVDWNVDSDDAGSAKTSEEIYNNVTRGLIPGHTNIVLMHDSANKSATLGALSDIIDYCLENDYDLQAITPETETVHHSTNN